MDGIFISYRRDDSAGYAGRLYDRLIPHFGANRVFMDVEGIELGTDFVTAIEEAVGSCRVLIVIIGDEWLKIADAAGRRRLEDPHDFIRLETVTALQRGIRVVPVLVGGALMPRADELPDDLKPLARRQAIEISHKQWEATTAELIRALEAILSSGAVADAAPRGPAQPPTHSSPPPPPPPDRDEAGKDRGQRRRPWVVSALLAAVALGGGGLWAVLNPRDTGTHPQAKSENLQTAKVPAGNTPSAAGTPAPPSVVVAATGPSPKPAAPAAAPPPPAAWATPAPVPAPAPAPAAPMAPVAPTIRTFQATAEAGGARLCYSVANADSVLIVPGPGEMHYRIKHCLRVDIDGPTTFTLTARNAVTSVSKSLKAAPRAPAETEVVAVAPLSPPPAPTPMPPVARAEPAATTSAGAPRVGESWTYRTSGKWPTSPKRNIVIAVQSVANDVVTDGLRAEGLTADVRRSAGAKPMFMAWNEIGNEFSPYLAAYSDMDKLGTLRGFTTPDVQPNWSQWYSEAKVIGQETVTVPAGRFQAHKVEVWSSRHATGGPTMAGIEPVRIHYLIWYAPQAKRYVKMQRRVLSASGAENERDVFELVARR
jgi:hypothetical protein